MCLHSRASLSATGPEQTFQNQWKILTALELAADTVGPVGAESTVAVDTLGVHRGAGLMDGG